MTVRELAGPHITDVIVCPQPYDFSSGDRPGRGMVVVEASVLVIGAVEDPGGRK